MTWEFANDDNGRVVGYCYAVTTLIELSIQRAGGAQPGMDSTTLETNARKSIRILSHRQTGVRSGGTSKAEIAQRREHKNGELRPTGYLSTWNLDRFTNGLCPLVRYIPISGHAFSIAKQIPGVSGCQQVSAF